MMGLPGAPLLYYGDEYGEWGGADPNNRAFWRGDKTLSAEETATLALARKLGTARKELSALRRGDYRSVYATDEVLVFARGSGALVAVSKVPSARTFTATLPLTLALMKNQMLHDRLGGPDVGIDANGTFTITLGPRGAVILAP
jgi:glycosidase